MAARWTDAALDAELADRVAAQARIADALVELDRHPGHRLLASTTLRGTSAERWAHVGALLPRLWADLALHRATVAAACAIRTRRARPTERDGAELRRLLVEPSVEVDRTAVALADRGIAGASTTLRTLTLRELAERMDGWFREAVTALDAAESVHLAALAALGPLAERLREARSRAAGLLDPTDPDMATLTELTEAVDVRAADCAHDPLAHAGRLPNDLAGVLATDVDSALTPVEARLTVLAAVRDAWAEQRAEVTAAVTALDALWQQEGRARRDAGDVVADPLPGPRDPRPALHRRLAALPGPTAWPGPTALAALPMLRADAADATTALRTAVERAVAVSDRYGELRGRFAAYRAKAVRLGLAEDPEVSASAARVAALFRHRPVDLRVLTPALVAYQQQVRADTAAPDGVAAGRPR